MPNTLRYLIAQSIAAITSLACPLPSAPQHLQVDQVRRRRHPRIGALGGVAEAARRDDAGDVRAVTVAGPGRGRAGR